MTIFLDICQIIITTSRGNGGDNFWLCGWSMVSDYKLKGVKYKSQSCQLMAIEDVVFTSVWVFLGQLVSVKVWFMDSALE